MFYGQLFIQIRFFELLNITDEYYELELLIKFEIRSEKQIILM